MVASLAHQSLPKRFERLGVTRRRLAAEAGVNENTLARVLKGRSANTATVDKIAEALAAREAQLARDLGVSVGDAA